MFITKLMRVAGLIGIAMGTMAPDTVAPIITDAVTQTNEQMGASTRGGLTPSGRPWHTSNYVLRHEFRSPGLSGRPPGEGAIVDAMPTPVNGQITDTTATRRAPGVYMETDGAQPEEVNGAIIDADTTPVNGQITDAVATPVNGQITDTVSNIKTPGVYIDEEVGFDTVNPQIIDSAPEGNDEDREGGRMGGGEMGEGEMRDEMGGEHEGGGRGGRD